MVNNNNIDDFKKHIQGFIDQRQEEGKSVNINDLNNHISKVVQTQNTAPKAIFNGFSSEQMSKLLYFPLKPGCPVQLKNLTDEEMGKIPFMRQALHLMNALEKKEIKLTQKGKLPIKMVEVLYKLGEQSMILDTLAQKTEERITSVRTLRVVLNETRLIKSQLGKLSLTDKGRQILTDHNQLLRSIFEFLFTEFNTGWYDPREDFNVGNIGRLYSIWLLHHYGSEWREVKFYAREYFKAFPQLKLETGNPYITYDDVYCGRVFNHLFYLLGLYESNEIINTEEHRYIIEVRKAPILDMMFSFQEPGKI